MKYSLYKFHNFITFIWMPFFKYQLFYNSISFSYQSNMALYSDSDIYLKKKNYNKIIKAILISHEKLSWKFHPANIHLLQFSLLLPTLLSQIEFQIGFSLNSLKSSRKTEKRNMQKTTNIFWQSLTYINSKASVQTINKKLTQENNLSDDNRQKVCHAAIESESKWIIIILLI